MYKIGLQATQATTTKPSTFAFMVDETATEWQTDDKREGLDKYEAELENYKKSSLDLIDVVNTNIRAVIVGDDGSDTPITPGVSTDLLKQPW